MIAHLETAHVAKRASAAMRAHVVKPASAENTTFTLYS